MLINGKDVMSLVTFKKVINGSVCEIWSRSADGENTRKEVEIDIYGNIKNIQTGNAKPFSEEFDNYGKNIVLTGKLARKMLSSIRDEHRRSLVQYLERTLSDIMITDELYEYIGADKPWVKFHIIIPHKFIDMILFDKLMRDYN